MKTLIILFLFGINDFQQPTSAFIKDFELVLEKDEVQINRSCSHRLGASILRGKGFQKAEAKMGISCFLPKGVVVQFTNGENELFPIGTIITTDSTAVPGVYSIILNATLNHKTKGSVFKLTIL